METNSKSIFGIDFETLDLPPHLRVNSALGNAPSDRIPNDVIDSMVENGFLSNVRRYEDVKVERIQVRFNETLKLVHLNRTFCLQFLGATLSENPVFDHQKPFCAEYLKVN